MDDGSHAFQPRGHRMPNVPGDALEPSVSVQSVAVPKRVDNSHPMTTLQKPWDERTAKVSGATGDKNHGIP